MATTTAVQGKGAYIVRSSLHRSDLLDESTFMRWYEEDHIPEVISTSRISSARRFVSTDLQADKPYLAMYPMDDIGFTQTKEFQAINVKSDILPGDHPIYDLADFDVRCDKLVHVHNNKEAKGSTKTLVFVASQLKELSDGGISAEELGEWYSQEVCLTCLALTWVRI